LQFHITSPREICFCALAAVRHQPTCATRLLRACSTFRSAIGMQKPPRGMDEEDGDLDLEEWEALDDGTFHQVRAGAEPDELLRESIQGLGLCEKGAYFGGAGGGGAGGSAGGGGRSGSSGSAGGGPTAACAGETAMDEICGECEAEGGARSTAAAVRPTPAASNSRRRPAAAAQWSAFSVSGEPQWVGLDESELRAAKRRRGQCGAFLNEAILRAGVR